jgi:rubrerythrin
VTDQEYIKDLLSDCEKLIQAAENLELQKIARINDVPVENLKVVRDALEKRIFEKPHIWGDGYADGEMVYDMYDCPRCGKSYEIDEQYSCCPNCGQAID